VVAFAVAFPGIFSGVGAAFTHAVHCASVGSVAWIGNVEKYVGTPPSEGRPLLDPASDPLLDPASDPDPDPDPVLEVLPDPLLEPTPLPDPEFPLLDPTPLLDVLPEPLPDPELEPSPGACDEEPQ
jgi:hypothetical protein